MVLGLLKMDGSWIRYGIYCLDFILAPHAIRSMKKCRTYVVRRWSIKRINQPQALLIHPPPISDYQNRDWKEHSTLTLMTCSLTKNQRATTSANHGYV